MSVISNAPYYDRYDPSKQYTQLLAVPGRVAQAREFTEMQTTLKDIVKSLGDSIMRDGNIIEGCQVIVTSNEITGRKGVIVTKGKVYISGMVLPYNPPTRLVDGVEEPIPIPITGVGEEYIGVKLRESIITELDDLEEDNTHSALNDPAQGYDNYNKPGCHRLKSEVVVVINDSEASTLTRLLDGEIAVEQYAPNYDTMTQTLARRTYDESGSYIVEGLNVRVETNTNSNKVTVVIESGKAYVLGYELKIPAARRLELNRSLSTMVITKSNYTYNSSEPEGVFQLDSSPYVQSVSYVEGKIQVSLSASVPSNNSIYPLPAGEDVSDLSIVQGSTTFVQDTDYFLETVSGAGDTYQIRWNEPTALDTNSQFTITYQRTYRFEQDTDYLIYPSGSLGGNNIKWIVSDNRPRPVSNFRVVYSQYLARKDIVYIDQYGDIAIALGTPARYGFEILPDIPVNTLPLAYIMSPPRGEISSNDDINISVTNVGLTRFTMNDINRMLNRIKTIEYDQAVIALNNEAKEYDINAEKKGIFTEPFIDVSKIDFNYNSAHTPGTDYFNACIDLDSSMCYLPVNTRTYDIVHDTVNSTTTEYKRTATLQKTGSDNIVLSQMRATKSFLINPYSQFPQLPEISIDPAVDAWIEDNIVQVRKSISSSQVVSMSSNTYANSQRVHGRFDNYSESSSSTIDTVVGTKVSVSTSERVIKEEPITYMRSKTINVEGSNFPPGLANISCYFDGRKLDLTATGDTVSGANGTIVAGDEGEFTASFTIPANTVLTGVREVKLESPIHIEGYQSSAIALYQAIGTLRTIQRTVTTLTTVLLNRVVNTTVTTYIDPVGQTFVLDKMSMVTAIDLYFENKPNTSNTPVTCEIREVVNGMITSTVYGHRTLAASAVSVSANSTVATRFLFEDPVLLEENKEYAFVVRSTSTNYRLWVAELGETDVLSGETVLSNPYLLGVMLSSSNNSSWTVHQTTDIKFRLVADTYIANSELVFEDIHVDSVVNKFSRSYLLAESIVPAGTTLDWQYKTNNDTGYKSVPIYNPIVSNTLNETVSLKAVMTKSENTKLSPIVALDSVASLLSSYEKDGCYLTRNITGLDAYDTVDIILDAYIPGETVTPTPNTSISVYVSSDDGTTLVEAGEVSSVLKNYSWEEKTYRASVTADSTQCRIFIKLHSEYEYMTPAFRRLRAIMS